MIQFQSMQLARGARTLLDALSLQIHPGWKVGLVGANGCGKSSLFALLRGQLHPARGDVSVPAGWRIAHVAQETPALDTPALEYVLDGDAPLRTLQAQLAQAEAQAEAGDHAAAVRIGELHEQMQQIDGYAAPARAAALLQGLGFAQATLHNPVASFSGGWRMRLNLAQALMSRADLLLLDEPTNHLDLEAVLWLEQWLRGFSGTLLLISHDRAFLDAAVGHIAHMENRQLRLYSGNYSDFERTRAARLANEKAMFDRQQREIAHMQDYIRRFRAKATKARQAQSRIKALERMERIACARVDRPVRLTLREAPPAPDPLLTLTDVAAGYDADKPVLQSVRCVLRPGDRIGLLGVNGAGKSTLVRLLAQELAPLAGTLRAGKGTVTGYFAQHQTDALRGEDSPLQHLLRLDATLREQDARNWLGGFGFRSDAEGEHAEAGANTPCATFSGGEKARLALALLIWKTPNLLLLDEPTNHLDLAMRDALTLALRDFSGALIVVSHDRALLEATCDRFWLIEDGRVREFDGDLEDYRAHQTERARAQTAAAPQVQRREARASARQAEKLARADWLAARRPLIKERDALEKRLATLGKERTLLEERLADPALYAATDSALLQDLLKRQGALVQEIDALEARWLTLEEGLEALGEAPGAPNM